MKPGVALMNIPVSYNQILGLALQLNEQDRVTLSRELTRSSRAKRLSDLRNMFATDEISQADICQECESVRQMLYEQRQVQ